jgi:hypothetical protein
MRTRQPDRAFVTEALPSVVLRSAKRDEGSQVALKQARFAYLEILRSAAASLRMTTGKFSFLGTSAKRDEGSQVTLKQARFPYLEILRSAVASLRMTTGEISFLGTSAKRDEAFHDAPH